MRSKMITLIITKNIIMEYKRLKTTTDRTQDSTKAKRKRLSIIERQGSTHTIFIPRVKQEVSSKTKLVPIQTSQNKPNFKSTSVPKYLKNSLKLSIKMLKLPNCLSYSKISQSPNPKPTKQLKNSYFFRLSTETQRFKPPYPVHSHYCHTSPITLPVKYKKIIVGLTKILT